MERETELERAKWCGRGKVAEILDFNVLSDVGGENYKLLNCRSHTPSLVKHLTLTYSRTHIVCVLLLFVTSLVTTADAC